MNISWLAIILILLLASSSSYACRPMKPNLKILNNQSTIVITSSSQKSILSIVPSKWSENSSKGFYKSRQSYALAYKVRNNGQLQQLWRLSNWDLNIKGWYSYGYPEFYLSSDGQILTEINRSVRDENERIAIIIYKNGKRIRSYSARNLGVNTILKHTCSYGSWVSHDSLRNKKSNQNMNYSGLDKLIKIKTTAGKTWLIDPEKGYLRAKSF